MDEFVATNNSAAFDILNPETEAASMLQIEPKY